MGHVLKRGPSGAKWKKAVGERPSWHETRPDDKDQGSRSRNSRKFAPKDGGKKGGRQRLGENER